MGYAIKINLPFMLGIGFTILATLAEAKVFKEVAPCGSANITEGLTCSNAKVSFKFEGCKSNFAARTAKSVECVGEVILAKYQEGDFRYEARFKKSEGAWESGAWVLDGNVKEFERKVSLTKALIIKNLNKKDDKKIEAKIFLIPTSLEKKEVSTLPTASSSSPIIILPPDGSPFKFSGFVDIRYTNFNVKKNPLISSGHSESGFGLEDGAFYTNYDKGNLSVVLDMAFRRSKDVDTNASAIHPNQSSNNNIAIGVDKSQLYLRYKINPALTFDLGQFDTIYGVEVNDSKDRIFGKTGLIYDYTLPVTHMGLMMEYSFFRNYYFKAFAANPSNRGSYGSSSSGDDKIETGGAFGYSSDNYHAQVGYMSRSINKTSALSSGVKYLLDILGGGILGKFAYDFEYARLGDANKNSLTPNDAGDNEKPGAGYFSLLAYKFTSEFQIGIRYEYLTNDPSAQGTKSSSAAGLSLHEKITSELEFRSEYIVYKNKGIAGNKWDDTRFNFAALVTF
jgi:hypothetical protein